jgi:hypothetical protein
MDKNICLKYIQKFFNAGNFIQNLSFDFKKITIEETKEALSKIKRNSAPGATGIESVVFKYCCEELSPIICHLFNLCLIKATIPNEWKTTMITPIYKGKGSKSQLDNYRPISILPPIAKIYEALISKQIRYYFESNKILNNAQFGFREHLSCEIALNTMIDSWKISLDCKKFVIAILLDLSKAFDTICHDLLIEKLKLYGFSSVAISIITDYLKERFIMVCLNGILSNKKLLSVGVPQGSVLGPLLFIIFINDMCYLNISSKLTLFADDTTVYESNSDIDLLIQTIKKDMSKLTEWLIHNRLVINWDKTYAMLFDYHHRTQQKRKIEIQIENKIIKTVEKTRLLGVIIDSKLKFDEHSIEICKQINKRIYLFKRCFYLFNIKFKIILFKLFIQSKFDYCSSLFFILNNEVVIKRLEKTFSKSLKKLLNINIYGLDLENQLKLLKKYELLPLHLRYFYHFSFFIYSLFKFNCKLNYELIKNINLCKIGREGLRNKLTLPKYDPTANHYKFSTTTLAIKLLNTFLYNYLNESKSNLKACIVDNITYYYNKFINSIT